MSKVLFFFIDFYIKLLVFLNLSLSTNLALVISTAELSAHYIKMGVLSGFSLTKLLNQSEIWHFSQIPSVHLTVLDSSYINIADNHI